MREIKFQAWLGHAMVQVVKLNFMKNVVGEYVRTGEGYFLDGENKGTHTGFVMSKVQLREYTGLHDKNGREIYEGDIIQTKYTKWLIEPIGSLEIDRNYYGLCASPYGSGENFFIDDSITNGKVIGNIYENPELLE